MDKKPHIIFINATWLVRAIGEVPMEGYVCFARRDRRNGQKGGGTCEGIASQIAELHESPDAERPWLILHTNQGPFFLANWYRPPCAGEVGSIRTLRPEWDSLKSMALGTIITGDLNIHYRPWLRFSQRDSTEGQQLHEISHDCCFSQLVQQPTRGENMLDLVLSDIDAKCKVVPKIADHSGVLVTEDLDVPQTKRHSRLVWHYNKADWDALRDALNESAWDCIASCSTHDGAEHMHARILEAAEEWIPRKIQSIVSKSHGWLTNSVICLVRPKRKLKAQTESELRPSHVVRRSRPSSRSSQSEAKRSCSSSRWGSKAW